MTPKQQLDFFRDFNGGALPPGMTPEMAGLIDSGIDISGMMTTNPALANVFMQIQQQILSIPGAYQAAKASVGQNYENLTGDVLASGKNWMQDLYGRMADPNANPNAALVAQDPALTAYAQQMSGIDETADLNQATDQAWFDKMQQNSTSMYQNMLAQLAAQAAQPVAGGGGGGGGGRGRRGGGGYGGGGGGSGKVNDWTEPKNTLTNEQSLTDTGTTTDTGYSPGFFEDLMAQTEGDPELQQLAYTMWNTSNQDPRGLTQDVQKALTEAQIQQETEDLQGQLHQSWFQSTPAAAQTAISKLMANNPGARFGDDPTTPFKTDKWFNNPAYREGDNPATKDVKERYWIDKNVPNVPEVRQYTEEQGRENSLAEELLNAQSNYGARELTNKIFGGKIGFGVRPGVASPARLLEEKTKGAISPQQIDILKRIGGEALLAAQKGDTPESPFNWKGWAETGGYVPGVDPEARVGRDKNRNYYENLLDIILPWNPNAGTVPTKEQLTTTGKDTSKYNTTNKNYGWGNALTGSPWDITPDIPSSGLSNNPVSNPTGFDIDENDKVTGLQEGDPGFTEEVSDFGGTGLTRALSGKRPTIPKYDRPTPVADVIRGAAKNRIRTVSTSRDKEPTSTRPKAELKLAPGAHARRNKYVPKKDRVTPALNITKDIFGKPKKKAAAAKKPPKGSPNRYR
jgi:hypothetical protein